MDGPGPCSATWCQDDGSIQANCSSRQQQLLDQHRTNMFPPSSISPGSNSLLGPDELDLINAFVQLESDARESTETMSKSEDSKSASYIVLDRKVQKALAGMRSQIRDLELLAEEQDSEEQAEAVEEQLDLHKAEYESLRNALMQAKLQTKFNSERLYQKQRQELLSGVTMEALHRQYRKESDLVAGTQDITDSLRRTRQVLAQQLENTAGNLDVLETTNETLSDARDELAGQKTLFKESHKQLKTLKQQSSGD
eukprot:gene21440-28406_t